MLRNLLFLLLIAFSPALLRGQCDSVQLTLFVENIQVLLETEVCDGDTAAVFEGSIEIGGQPADLRFVIKPFGGSGDTITLTDTLIITDTLIVTDTLVLPGDTIFIPVVDTLLLPTVDTICVVFKDSLFISTSISVDQGDKQVTLYQDSLVACEGTDTLYLVSSGSIVLTEELPDPLDRVMISPNPTVNIWGIVFTDTNNDEGTYRLFNSTGDLLQQGNFFNDFDIDATLLGPGFYPLLIEYDDGKYSVIKLVKI